MVCWPHWMIQLPCSFSAKNKGESEFSHILGSHTVLLVRDTRMARGHKAEKGSLYFRLEWLERQSVGQKLGKLPSATTAVCARLDAHAICQSGHLCHKCLVLSWHFLLECKRLLGSWPECTARQPDYASIPFNPPCSALHYTQTIERTKHALAPGRTPSESNVKRMLMPACERVATVRDNDSSKQRPCLNGRGVDRLNPCHGLVRPT